MMTSRAEYRLLLREDNADERLTPLGRRLGLVDDVRWAAFESRAAAVRAELERLRGTVLTPTASVQDRLAAVGVAPLRRPTTLEELLRRPEVGYATIAALAPAPAPLAAAIAERVEIRIKYEGYLGRQDADAARFRSLEELELPAALEYATMAGLSREVTEKLERVRPRSIGQASRIAGVTPAAVSILIGHLRAASRATC